MNTVNSNIDSTDIDNNIFNTELLDEVITIDNSYQEDKVANKNKKQAELINKYSAALNQELRANDLKPIKSVIAQRYSTNDTTSSEYFMVKMVISHIIKHPELTRSHTVFSDVWKELSELGYKANYTKLGFNKSNRTVITAELKAIGISKPFINSSDIISLVRDYDRVKHIAKLENENRELRLLIDDASGSIFYKGHEIKRLSREFRINLNGELLSAPLNGIDKLLDIFDCIDMQL